MIFNIIYLNDDQQLADCPIRRENEMAEKIEQKDKTCYKCEKCGNVLLEIEDKGGKKELSDEKYKKYFYYDDEAYYTCPHCDARHSTENMDKGLVTKIIGMTKPFA